MAHSRRARSMGTVVLFLAQTTSEDRSVALASSWNGGT
jgi:hypothetical protein